MLKHEQRESDLRAFEEVLIFNEASASDLLRSPVSLPSGDSATTAARNDRSGKQRSSSTGHGRGRVSGGSRGHAESEEQYLMRKYGKAPEEKPGISKFACFVTLLMGLVVVGNCADDLWYL